MHPTPFMSRTADGRSSLNYGYVLIVWRSSYESVYPKTSAVVDMLVSQFKRLNLNHLSCQIGNLTFDSHQLNCNMKLDM